MNTNSQKPAISKEQITAISKMANDQEFRQKLRDSDALALAQIGFENLNGSASPEIKVVTSTQDVTYLPMPFPANPLNRPITPEQMARIQGGRSFQEAHPELLWSCFRSRLY